MFDELAPFERVPQQTVDVPMPEILKATAVADEFAPFERVPHQTVDVPMPEILKETAEADEFAHLNGCNSKLSRCQCLKF